MRKETVKTIIIALLSIIFIAHSIEKKSIIDKLQAENNELQLLVDSGNMLMRAATSSIVGLQLTLKKCSEELNKNKDNVHNVTVTM